MPSIPRSKYVAVCRFSVAGFHFEEGQPVTGVALVEAMKYGGKFVAVDTPQNPKKDGDDAK